MRIFPLTPKTRENWQAHLEQLEASISYPYGDDFFTINHGPDYFAFFERLGEPVCYIAAQENELAAVGVGVLRQEPVTHKRYWYLCDLKVAEEFRGRKLTHRMFRRSFLWNYLRCRRGYAISMNPAGNRPNRVVSLVNNLPWTPLKLAGELQIYSLNHEQMLATEDLLRKHRGPISYLSLRDKKDLVMQSSGEGMKLLHAQFGPYAETGVASPVADHTHMFCALAGSELDRDLRTAKVSPGATAALLQHNMHGFDWDLILTSDL